MSRDRCKCPAQAFKEYVKMILTRKNTITGLVYSEDPGIRLFEPLHRLADVGWTSCLRAKQPTLCLALGQLLSMGMSASRIVSMNILIVYGKINLMDPASKPLTPPAVKAHRDLACNVKGSASIPKHGMPRACGCCSGPRDEAGAWL